VYICVLLIIFNFYRDKTAKAEITSKNEIITNFLNYFESSNPTANLAPQIKTNLNQLINNLGNTFVQNDKKAVVEKKLSANDQKLKQLLNFDLNANINPSNKHIYLSNIYNKLYRKKDKS